MSKVVPIVGEPDINPANTEPYWNGNPAAGKPQKRAHSPLFNRVCVVHTTENPITSTAKNVMDWQNRTTKNSGYHFECDREAWYVFMNPLTTRAYQAGKSEKFDGQTSGNNHIGMALVAEANEWSKVDPSDRADAIEVAARCAAYIHLTYGVPLRKISREDYKAGVEGFLGHEDVAIPPGRKSDPGRKTGFPWAYFIGKAQAYAQAHKDKQAHAKKVADAKRKKEVEKMRAEQKKVAATLPPKPLTRAEENAEFISEMVEQLRDAGATPNSVKYDLRFYRRIAEKAGIDGSKPEEVADWLLRGTHYH